MKERQLFLTIPDFLSDEDHQAVLDFALASEDICVPTRVEGVDTQQMRSSLGIPKGGPCRAIIEAAVRPLVDEWCQAFALPSVPDHRFDASIVAHPDGAFYKPHVDVAGKGTHRTRTLSVVYYFYRKPAGFSGGDLRMFRLDQPGTFVDVPAIDNQLVVFPSMIPHEVRPVSVPSGRYDDSRFAFNLWVHRTTA